MAESKRPLAILGAALIASIGCGGGVVASSATEVSSGVTAGTLSLFAGVPGGPGNLDGTGSAARFSSPYKVAVDGSENLYVADTGNNTIRKITPAGVVTTLAGTPGQYGSNDGTGSAALFSGPSAVAVDASGNVYVADTGNNTIRLITPAGVVTTLAGSAEEYGSSDGTGSSARFAGPSGIAVDSSGNIYVADTLNSTIRVLSQGGVVTTLAGSAGQSGAGDGTGPAAQFNAPSGLAVDSAGNLYVADTGNNEIRMITPSAVVSTPAGTVLEGFADGQGNAAQFSGPSGVAVDGSGNLYVADTGNDTIRQIASGWGVTTMAGTASQGGSSDGQGASARFQGPSGLGVDGAGNVYVADTGNSTVRKITADDVVSTLAGLAAVYGSSDGPGSAADFNLPTGIAVDTSGTVYVADTGNNIIRRIDATGVVTTPAGTAGQYGSVDGTGPAAQFIGPTGVAVNGSGGVYIADTGNNTIRMMTPAGVVTTVAGEPGQYGSADGTGSAALFNGPSGLAAAAAGLYIADTGNCTIRLMRPAGAVTTIAGTPGEYGSADGTGSAAQFNAPTAVAVDGSGNVYVADTGNSTIRKITPTGNVTTLAGTAGQSGYADGAGTAALFNAPSGLAIDADGDLFVADTGNHTVRLVTSAGVVTTLVGAAGRDGTVPGPLPASLDFPAGIAFDPASGDLLVTVQVAVLEVSF